LGRDEITEDFSFPLCLEAKKENEQKEGTINL